jgi:molybdate transport system substrate-binding protein
VRRSQRAQRGMSVKRVIVVSVCALLVLCLLVGIGYGVRRVLDRGGSDVVTRTLGGGKAGDPNTISIYAPSQLSKPLERITTAFQQEYPGTTFQFTLGPASDLAKRIQDGQKPSLFIETPASLATIRSARPIAPPVNFGYDWVQLAVRRGNPKQVRGLDAFGPNSAVTTGICAPELFCGQADARVLQSAGINAAPKVVTSNVTELTDGVKNGSIDAVLLLRSDLRAVITKITAPPFSNTYRLDYQMAQFQSGGRADQFVQWLQTAPTARQTLRSAGMLSFYDQ